MTATRSRGRPARRTLILAAVVLAAIAPVVGHARASSGAATVYSPTGQYSDGALLPNGRLVKPVGTVLPVGDFPVAVVASPRGDIAVISNAGQGEGGPEQGNESLAVVDLTTDRVVQTITDHASGKDTFYNEGVAFSPDGTHVYVTGGGNDRVYDYHVDGGRLSLGASWVATRKAGLPQLPEAANIYGYPRNVAVSADGKRIYVTNEQGSTVSALDTGTGAIVWESPLPTLGVIGPYPAGLALSPDGRSLYVAAQGLNVVFDLDPVLGLIRGATPVGDHPVAVAVSRSGFGFVANDNDDSLSVLDLTGSVPAKVQQLSLHLFAGEANGSAPNAIAIDEARKLVYVADAGDDAVAVVGESMTSAPAAWHPSKLTVLGYLPTAWYPTGVSVLPADGSLLAVSAKGYGGVPVTDHNEYDGNDMVGLLQHIPRPRSGGVAAGRQQALSGLRFAIDRGPNRPPDNPIPDEAHAGLSPIKHVVLVVRENRTFDQVFGDLPALGWQDVDADPSFVEFGRTDATGRTVTPNAHDIARRFAISDNFYSDGEASVQGHFWTALGVTTDYAERSWLQFYSDRHHPNDESLPVSYPRCGSIFQQLALAGKTFRNFGELEGLVTSQALSAPAPDAACPLPGGVADAASVANLDAAGGNNLTLTTLKDTLRLNEFEKIYTPLAAANAVPDFSYVIMGNDHTGGALIGSTTPQAQVATNDLAVGGLVDYLSHTPQWNSTAVFVMEDDSQDGLDHRDGHRNVLLVASPFAKQHNVSHLHISQASILHTISLILGIPPMSSYVQSAPVPYDMFSAVPAVAPYRFETPTYPIDLANPSPIYGTPAALSLDLSAVDLAGPALEAQIWWATHPGQPMPRALLDELAARRDINPAALKAWAAGRVCACAVGGG